MQEEEFDRIEKIFEAMDHNNDGFVSRALICAASLLGLLLEF